MMKARIILVPVLGLASAASFLPAALATPTGPHRTPPAATSAGSPARTGVTPAWHHRPPPPSYPPTTGRLYVSRTRVHRGATIAAFGSGFAPNSTVQVTVSLTGPPSGDDDDAAPRTLTSSSEPAARHGHDGARCSTGRTCLVRANRRGLIVFTVRLTRSGWTTITATGVDPAGSPVVLSATVLVTGRRH